MRNRPCPKCETGLVPDKKGYSYCLSCTAKTMREWRQKNLVHVRAYERKRYQEIPSVRRSKQNSDLKLRFGITLDEKESILKSQDGKCAICFEKTSGKNAHIDHSHTTGKIRGILCNSCNNGLGRFKDSIQNLQSAIVYLSYSG